MTKQIFCQKLKQEAEALDHPPFPGPFGERIAANISKPAWNQWLSHQTMLINEYRLSLADPKAREFLRTNLEKFLFEGETDPPPWICPPREIKIHWPLTQKGS